MQIIYITVMIGFENDQYILGVFDSEDKAERAGMLEESWFQGKYSFVVQERKLNEQKLYCVGS